MKLILGTQYSAGVFNGLMILGASNADLSKIIEIASQLNIQAIDTSPIYGYTIAESTIGKSNWNGAIWTKIGVDVNRPLPQINYSVSSMEQGLLQSLNRLNRNFIDVAFIHNPPIALLSQIDICSIAKRWKDELSICNEIGVSLRSVFDIDSFLKIPASNISKVMVELPQSLNDMELIRELAKYYTVIIRGIFLQGTLFTTQSQPFDNYIKERLQEIKYLTNADFCIIAPRTLSQASDYLSIASEVP